MNLKKQRRPGRQLPRGSLIVKYILVLLIAVVLPFAGVLFAVSAKATAMERSRTLENFDESLKIISLSIDNTLSSAETLHSSLLLDDTFQSTLKSLPPISRTPEFTELQTVRTIKSTLSRIAVRDRMIRNIYLYCPDVHRLFLSDSTSADYKPTDVSNTGWFTDFTRQDGTNRWVLTTALEDDTPLVCSYRLMPGAMLSINLSAQRVADILAETNPYEAVSCFLLDAYGTVLPADSADQTLVQAVCAQLDALPANGGASVEHQGQTVYCRVRTSAYSGFRVVMCAYQEACSTISSSFQQLFVWYVLDAVLLIALAILLTYCIVIKPLTRLSQEMRRSENGDLSVRLPDEGRGEIQEIYHRFNKMNASIAHLIEENYVSEIRKQSFELKLLSTQINEHFLYNALDAIRWMAQREHAPVTGQSICSLASFYRIGLAYGSDTITVQELHEMTGSYLLIEQLLNPDMLYEVSIAPELFGLRVPKYLFVPLLDNAIAHGIKALSGGVVCVSLERCAPDTARFTVSDNGHGIGPERLQQIQYALAHPDMEGSDCFALRNLTTQLQIYFKITNGLHIRTKEGAGTTVCFEIPLNWEGGDPAC